MARRRSRSVRRRKQRGGEKPSFLSSITSFFSRNPPSVPNPNDIQPAQPAQPAQPSPQPPQSKKYEITTSEAAAVIKLSNKLHTNTEDSITIGTIIEEDISTPGDSTIKYYKVLNNTLVKNPIKIPINYINLNHGFVEVKPMTGGRRRSRRRSNRKRSTRKQRR